MDDYASIGINDLGLEVPNFALMVVCPFRIPFQWRQHEAALNMAKSHTSQTLATCEVVSVSRDDEFHRSRWN